MKPVDVGLELGLGDGQAVRVVTVPAKRWCRRKRGAALRGCRQGKYSEKTEWQAPARQDWVLFDSDVPIVDQFS
jgi:hypothetical protein